MSLLRPASREFLSAKALNRFLVSRLRWATRSPHRVRELGAPTNGRAFDPVFAPVLLLDDPLDPAQAHRTMPPGSRGSAALAMTGNPRTEPEGDRGCLDMGGVLRENAYRFGRTVPTYTSHHLAEMRPPGQGGPSTRPSSETEHERALLSSARTTTAERYCQYKLRTCSIAPLSAKPSIGFSQVFDRGYQPQLSGAMGLDQGSFRSR